MFVRIGLPRVVRHCESLRRLVTVAALVLAVNVVPASAAPILYGASGGALDDSLYTLDPTTGAVISTVGNIGFFLTGLAMNPITGILYGVTSTRDDIGPSLLVSVNTSTGAGTAIGSLGNALRVSDIAFTSDGTLYAATSSGLGTINLATGLVTPVGGLILSGGLAVDATGNLFYAGLANTLFQLDKTTGTIIGQQSTGLSSTLRISALAYDPTTLAILGVERPRGGSIFLTMDPAGILGDTVSLDAIAFSTQVPEPTSLALLGVGAIAGLMRLRRSVRRL